VVPPLDEPTVLYYLFLSSKFSASKKLDLTIGLDCVTNHNSRKSHVNLSCIQKYIRTFKVLLFVV